jgi:transcription elongation factor Elf1
MKQIENSAPHKFEKQNLVTLMDRKGAYDLMKCDKCGIQGKARALGTVDVSDSYSLEKVNNCDGVVEEKPKQIKITFCHACGKRFSNLTPGSLHIVVDPPHPHVNDHKGVWVMGIGEPVKVLNSEFEAD